MVVFFPTAIFFLFIYKGVSDLSVQSVQLRGVLICLCLIPLEDSNCTLLGVLTV